MSSTQMKVLGVAMMAIGIGVIIMVLLTPWPVHSAETNDGWHAPAGAYKSPHPYVPEVAPGPDGIRPPMDVVTSYPGRPTQRHSNTSFDVTYYQYSGDTADRPNPGGSTHTIVYPESYTTVILPKSLLPILKKQYGSQICEPSL